MATNKRLIRSNDEAAELAPASFNTVLYTGDSGNSGNTLSKTVTGFGFQPDLIWGKNRDYAGSHVLFDSVRSPENWLSSNSTNPESTNIYTQSTILPDGFTTGTSDGLNRANDRFVAWGWKAGGAAVTNTNGSIPSQVSAAAGFSIVSYTGNGIANSTIGHGLGVKPDIVLVKARSTSYEWQLYSSAISTATYPTLNGRLALHSTLAATFDSYTVEVADNTFEWTGLASTFAYFNQNTIDYIAYCFHSVDGYQKVGSYSGSNSTVTETINFRPRFLLIKRTNDAGNWLMFDSVRNPTNPLTLNLDANNSEIEENNTNYRPSFLSDGFSIPNGSAGINTINNTYIYLAIA